MLHSRSRARKPYLAVFCHQNIPGNPSATGRLPVRGRPPWPSGTSGTLVYHWPDEHFPDRVRAGLARLPAGRGPARSPPSTSRPSASPSGKSVSRSTTATSTCSSRASWRPATAWRTTPASCRPARARRCGPPSLALGFVWSRSLALLWPKLLGIGGAAALRGRHPAAAGGGWAPSRSTSTPARLLVAVTPVASVVGALGHGDPALRRADCLDPGLRGRRRGKAARRRRASRRRCWPRWRRWRGPKASSCWCWSSWLPGAPDRTGRRTGRRGSPLNPAGGPAQDRCSWRRSWRRRSRSTRRWAARPGRRPWPPRPCRTIRCCPTRATWRPRCGAVGRRRHPAGFRRRRRCWCCSGGAAQRLAAARCCPAFSCSACPSPIRCWRRPTRRRRSAISGATFSRCCRSWWCWRCWASSRRCRPYQPRPAAGTLPAAHPGAGAGGRWC